MENGSAGVGWNRGGWGAIRTAPHSQQQEAKQKNCQVFIGFGLHVFIVGWNRSFVKCQKSHIQETARDVFPRENRPPLALEKGQIAAR